MGLAGFGESEDLVGFRYDQRPKNYGREGGPAIAEKGKIGLGFFWG